MMSYYENIFSETLCDFFYTLPQSEVYDPKTATQKELEKLVGLYRQKLEITARKGYELHHFSSFRSANMMRPKGSNVFIFPQPRYFPTVSHAHDYFEFGILLEGECRHFVHNTVLQMRAGDVIVIPPGTKHQPVMLTDACIWFDIGIRSEEIIRVLSHLWREKNPFLSFLAATKDDVSENAYAYFQADRKNLSDIMEFFYKESPEFGDMLYILKRELIAELIVTELLRCKNAFFQKDIQKSANPEDGMIRYIQGHFKTITRKALAEQFSYSERQITRILMKHTGKNFQGYLSKVRMDYILDMLENTLVPIHEIIEAAGYHDNNNFFRLFRQQTGMTPGEYRKHKQS